MINRSIALILAGNIRALHSQLESDVEFNAGKDAAHMGAVLREIAAEAYALADDINATIGKDSGEEYLIASKGGV